jgi:hypothetical protein
LIDRLSSSGEMVNLDQQHVGLWVLLHGILHFFLLSLLLNINHKSGTMIGEK